MLAKQRQTVDETAKQISLLEDFVDDQFNVKRGSLDGTTPASASEKDSSLVAYSEGDQLCDETPLECQTINDDATWQLAATGDIAYAGCGETNGAAWNQRHFYTL